MTTKKRSKPRAIWAVMSADNVTWDCCEDKKEARFSAGAYSKNYARRAPFTIVKYTREVKRRKGR